MSETAYIDELLKAEQEATEIIENAQKARYDCFFYLWELVFFLLRLM
jgi:hypothetical protein